MSLLYLHHAHGQEDGVAPAERQTGAYFEVGLRSCTCRNYSLTRQMSSSQLHHLPSSRRGAHTDTLQVNSVRENTTSLGGAGGRWKVPNPLTVRIYSAVSSRDHLLSGGSDGWHRTTYGSV